MQPDCSPSQLTHLLFSENKLTGACVPLKCTTCAAGIGGSSRPCGRSHCDASRTADRAEWAQPQPQRAHRCALEPRLQTRYSPVLHCCYLIPERVKNRALLLSVNHGRAWLLVTQLCVRCRSHPPGDRTTCFVANARARRQPPHRCVAHRQSIARNGAPVSRRLLVPFLPGHH